MQQSQWNGTAIRNRTFRRRLQGDDHDEVARFLEELAAEFDRIASDNAALGRRITELETKLEDYRSVEKALQQTLAQAQDSTAKAVENARREAQLIIQDAEMKASQLIERSRSDLTALREQVTILGARRDSIIARLKMLLHSELELVRALEADEDLRRSPAAESPRADAPPAGDIDEVVRGLGEA